MGLDVTGTITFLLNKCADARCGFVNWLAYATLRVYGFEEITYENVKLGRYDSPTASPMHLETTQDIDFVLKIAEELEAKEDKRRVAIADKCKLLLTLGSLLLGIAGSYLPKYFASDSFWLRLAAACAVGLLFNVIVVLLVVFDVGVDSEISLEQTEIGLDRDNLRKSFLNQRLSCCSAAENRTNYQVDLYRAARFCFLCALTLIASLFLFSIMTSIPADETRRIVQEIRSDSSLIELLRGPKGAPGDAGMRGRRGDDGKTGPKGDAGTPGKSVDLDEILGRLVVDPRFLIQLEKAARQKGKTESRE